MDSRDVLRECAIRGLAVRVDALQMMKEYVQTSLTGDPLHALIDAIVARLDHHPICVVDSMIVSEAVRDVSAEQLGAATTSLECIDAWLTPKLTYDFTAKTFGLEHGVHNASASPKRYKASSQSLHSSAITRADMFRMRHELSWQRVTRNRLFAHRHISESSELSRLDSLRGVAVGVRRCVLGSLLQIEEGSIYLEDSHAVMTSISVQHV
jgi:hypothetical protein